MRGYCCVSQSAAQLRQAIVSGQTDSETIGQSVSMDNGAKDTEMGAIAWRVDIDSDTSSQTYAAFLPLSDDSYTGVHGNDSACAEYIGAWTQGVTPPNPSGSGGYRIRLFR